MRWNDGAEARGDGRPEGRGNEEDDRVEDEVAVVREEEAGDRGDVAAPNDVAGVVGERPGLARCAVLDDDTMRG